jgi:putative transposase
MQERFVVTTNSNHKLEILYLILANRMKLTGVNQLRVVDITYIWLNAEFVYLAVILESRHPEPGLVHHSDRGLQYASEEYAKVLENNRVIPSMSRPANPFGQRELRKFHEHTEAGRNLCQHATTWNICEQISNSSSSSTTIGCACTRHSALGYRPPEEFEQQIEASGRPNREAQRWCFLRTKRTAGRFRKDYWGRDSNAVSFPSPLLLLGDARILL